MKSQDKAKTRANNSLKALNFFAEMGLLKHIRRSGWWVAGIKDPESVAEHSFRCAIMAFYIAIEEGADANRAMSMALFNDIHEARINDLHKMGHHYIDFRDAERKVFKDQVAGLEKKVKDEFTSIREEYENQKSKESIIARDADILECLIQAKEYLDSGYKKTEKFFRKAPSHLHTKTAKEIWKSIKGWDSGSWWEKVVKFER